MNTRILTILSLFVGIGTVLHYVMPPFFFGMRPDMMLAMMFLGIMLFPKPRYVLLLSLATGLIAAITTTVPGGQVANLIDKPLSAAVFMLLLLSFRKGMEYKALPPLLTAVGTMVSGSIFLCIVIFLLGVMQTSFTALFLAVVLPTAVLNGGIMLVIYPLAKAFIRRSQMTGLHTPKAS
ncbi:tryptophan transporter [Halobacillus salinarum]|uniref:Tryptophan transporter n=1 Tax=Halobacillus salinarum TaxID=2932257 RepID=A0ABY4EHM9_9BACI|nr:tryptophan transporter [Halobacillus salinarum]UOQ43505.1 tryptophan transporter [Halobacillus salinarum]